MSERFFDRPILNSPYEYPARHWELDESGHLERITRQWTKGYRREDAEEKKDTMNTYWVPGVNGLRTYGRWDFVGFGEVYAMQTEFAAKVEAEFARIVDAVVDERSAA